jgi:pimeloyl-ACP methyl ester carboxylesterase
MKLHKLAAALPFGLCILSALGYAESAEDRSIRPFTHGGRAEDAAGEVYRAPGTWAGRAYPNLIYFNEVDKGGHFAAWEQPQLFAEQIRAAFPSLREAPRTERGQS